MKLIAVPDPLMMVWAAVICVLLTAVRENLNRVLFKVSEGRQGGRKDETVLCQESLAVG